MSQIPWGKPRLFTKDMVTTGAKAYELATPVEDSTTLTPTKGDKLEAKIEGGENEDVKYKKSTYALNFNIRKAKGRKAPYPAEDGIVNNHFGIMLMPEDDTCEGFFIEKNTVSIDDTYTAADGAIWACQLDAVKATSGDTVKWGTVKVTQTTGQTPTTSVTFTEKSSVETGGTPFTVTWEVDASAQGGTAAGDNS